MMEKLYKRFLGMAVIMMVGMIVGCTEKDDWEWNGISLHETVYYIDGNNIRKGHKGGETIYYIDGNYIRKGHKGGETMYYIDGNYIRKGYKGGQIMYYIDGNNIGK